VSPTCTTASHAEHSAAPPSLPGRPEASPARARCIVQPSIPERSSRSEVTDRSRPSLSPRAQPAAPGVGPASAPARRRAVELRAMSGMLVPVLQQGSRSNGSGPLPDRSSRSRTGSSHFMRFRGVSGPSVRLTARVLLSTRRSGCFVTQRRRGRAPCRRSRLTSYLLAVARPCRRVLGGWTPSVRRR
jgi:hypothetical protein